MDSERSSAIESSSSFGMCASVNICSWIGKKFGDETGEKRDTCVATKQQYRYIQQMEASPCLTICPFHSSHDTVASSGVDVGTFNSLYSTRPVAVNSFVLSLQITEPFSRLLQFSRMTHPRAGLSLAGRPLCARPLAS